MKLNHIYLTVMVAALLFSACSNELQLGQGNAEEVPVQLTLAMSSADNQQRSITLSEESEVDHVDVLAFYKDGSDFRYAYKATNIRLEPSGANLKITATVKGYSSEQMFLIFTNSSAELAAVTIPAGERLENVVDKITCAAGNGEFPARINGTGSFKYIPMYAKTTPQVITKSTGNIGIFPMLRMVARINVKLKSTITNFELKCAALYNYKKAGYVAYDFSTFNGVDKVTAAAVPSVGNHSGTPILEPTIWHNAVANVIDNSIFTYESPAFTEADRLTGTAVVIGGFYGGNTSKLVYYRINLNLGASGDYPDGMDILRNHSYNIEVQSVAEPGAETGIDAYIGKAKVNVHISVLPWMIIDINGDILGRELSVSALEKMLLNSNTERVYFNSNQETVTLDAIGKNTVGADVAVTTFLQDPANTNFHYTYNPTTKKGEGYVDLTAVSSATDGTYRIYVNAGGLRREIKVHVPFKLPSTYSPFCLSDGYVGAFWKGSQTGERLIKIPISNGRQAGKWTVQVYEYGGFSVGDIVFDTNPSADPNIYTANPANMNDPVSDALYTVNSTDQCLMGLALEGDTISFRIGLKSTWSDHPRYHPDYCPARYALILLSYCNNTYFHEIYLRQGEDADYIVHPYDRDIAQQPYVRKFSPYNLMADNPYRETSVWSPYYYYPMFMEYPTQIGALYQAITPEAYWGRAYHPAKEDYTIGWWSDPLTPLYPDHGSCPHGYRRPTGGATVPGTTSEVGWSLSVDPTVDPMTISGLGISGYYADGFFDRRVVVDPTGYGYSPMVVDFPEFTVAAQGILYANNIPTSSHKNASCFFPSGGCILPSGYRDNIGRTTQYWTAANSSNQSTFTLPYGYSLSNPHALPVRCVKAPVILY